VRTVQQRRGLRVAPPVQRVPVDRRHNVAHLSAAGARISPSSGPPRNNRAQTSAANTAGLCAAATHDSLVPMPGKRRGAAGRAARLDQPCAVSAPADAHLKHLRR